MRGQRIQRWFWATIIVAVVTGIVVGCGGGGSGGVLAPSGTVPNAGHVRGFLFAAPGAAGVARSSLGSAVTGTGASSHGGAQFLVAGPFVFGDNVTPPAGLAPVAGATLRIEGAGLSTTTGADGSFLLRNVPAGQRALAIRSAIGTTARQPLTVVANATTVLGQQRRTRAAAIALLRQRVLNSLPNQNTILVMGSQHPLPAGSVLTEDNPAEPTRPERTPLARPAWYFFVDSFWTSAFGHPVKHVLIDDETGAVTVRDGSYWPKLNGIDLWVSLRERRGDDLVQRPTVRPEVTQGLGFTPGAAASRAVASRAVIHRPASVANATGVAVDPSRMPREHAGGCPQAKNYLIVIHGTEEEPFIQAATKFAAALSPAVQRPIAPTPNGNFGDLYKLQYEALNAQMQPCDTLWVYFAGHGGWGKDIKQPFSTVGYRRTDERLGEARTQWITAAQLLRPMLNPDTPLRACHLVFVVDSCYSGSMISNPGLEGFTFPPNMNRLAPQIEAVAVVSTNYENTALFEGSSAFSNQADLGGKFTNEFNASGALGRPPRLIAITVNDSLKQSPSSVTSRQGASAFYRAATAPCVSVVPTPTSGIAPTPTPTTTNTPTPTPTARVTPTPTPRVTPTPTVRPTATPTVTPHPTATPTAQPTPTVTPRPTATPTPRPTPTSTPRPTPTPTFTPPQQVVILDFTFSSGGRTFNKDDIIALSRITGGFVAQPDRCETLHLHAATPQGIRIDGVGPFPDPNPTSCGYGSVTTFAFNRGRRR